MPTYFRLDRAKLGQTDLSDKSGLEVIDAQKVVKWVPIFHYPGGHPESLEAPAVPTRPTGSLRHRHRSTSHLPQILRPDQVILQQIPVCKMTHRGQN